MIVVVMSVDVDVDVDVDVAVDVSVSLGGGGGTEPGECIVPAKTETASTMPSIATAHVRRKLFTGPPPRKKRYKSLCISANNANSFVFHPRPRLIFLQEGQ